MFIYKFVEIESIGRGGNVLKNKEIFNVFFREKPAMMLVVLKNTKSEMYASSLAKQIDLSLIHI